MKILLICSIFAAIIFVAFSEESKKIGTHSEEKNEEGSFYVANGRNTLLQMGQNHPYDLVFINKGDMFQPSTNTVKIKPGHYWFSFTVVSKSYLGSFSDKIDTVEFRQDPRPQKLLTTQFELYQPGSNIEMAQETLHSTQVEGDVNGTETSWLGFRIRNDDVFRGLSKRLLNSGAVTFDKTHFDGQSFSVIEGSKILFRKPGYFYVSFTYPTRRDVSTILKKNTTPLTESQVEINSLNYLSTITASKGIIVEMQLGDFLEMEILKGQIFSAEMFSTSLSIMSLATSSHFASVMNQRDFISLDMMKVEFEVVKANNGDSWDTNNDQFVCKSSGIYKVSMTLGARYNYEILMEIMKNNRIIGRLQSTGNQDQERRALSKSLLVELELNDVIYVRGSGVTDVGVTSTNLNIFKI